LEICICAAVKCPTLLIRGHRHADCFRNLSERPMKVEGPFEQGFITSRNRFVDREEGLRLQLRAGVPAFGGDGYQDQLYSEDLY